VACVPEVIVGVAAGEVAVALGSVVVLVAVGGGTVAVRVAVGAGTVAVRVGVGVEVRPTVGGVKKGVGVSGGPIKPVPTQSPD